MNHLDEMDDYTGGLDGSLTCTCLHKAVVHYRVEEVLDLWIFSSSDVGGNEDDETTARYEEEASWAKAGTAPPVDFPEGIK